MIPLALFRRRYPAAALNLRFIDRRHQSLSRSARTRGSSRGG